MNDTVVMQEAIDLARNNVVRGGQPFGAVLGAVDVRASQIT